MACEPPRSAVAKHVGDRPCSARLLGSRRVLFRTSLAFTTRAARAAHGESEPPEGERGCPPPVRARRDAPARGRPLPNRSLSLAQGGVSETPPSGAAAGTRPGTVTVPAGMEPPHPTTIKIPREWGRTARRSARGSHRGIVWNVPPASRVPSAGRGAGSLAGSPGPSPPPSSTSSAGRRLVNAPHSMVRDPSFERCLGAGFESGHRFCLESGLEGKSLGSSV